MTVEVEPLAGKTVRIGQITAQTPELEWDVPYIDEIVSADLNKFADMLGYDVTFEILNDNADAQAAVHLEKVQSFKAMDVSLVCGGRWSSQASAALSYVNENNILLWSPSSTMQTLAIPDDNLYRMCPADRVQAKAVAEMLWTWGIEAIIPLQRADAWADGLYNLVMEEFPAVGGYVDVINALGRSGYNITANPGGYLDYSDPNNPTFERFGGFGDISSAFGNRTVKVSLRFTF